MNFEDLNKIVVMMGGPGGEREVSLNMGNAIAEALKEAVTDGTAVETLVADGPDFELPEGTDLVFNAMPGTFGEDGQLQQILERRHVPYTGTDSHSSHVAFDKIISKERFKIKNIPTPEWQVINKDQPDDLKLRAPLVIKPPRDGSSVGVMIIREQDKVLEGIEESGRHAPDGELLAEKCIEGRELTVGILGSQILPVIEIKPKSGFYDYKNKYTKGNTDYLCPAPLDEEVTRKVQEVAMRAYNSLQIQVYARVDLLLDAEDQPWVLEINTIPGMTETSLLPKAAAEVGMDYPGLCRKIAELSLARHERFMERVK